MDQVPTTGAFLGITHMFKKKKNGIRTEEKTFRNFWDEEMNSALKEEKDRNIYVSPLKLELPHVHLEKKLGAGVFGQAWTCTLADGLKYVVKFPVQYAVREGVGKPACISVTRRPSKKATKDNVHSFTLEMKNFERMMEPQSYVRDFAKGQHFASTMQDGSLPPEANRAKYTEYAAEMKKIMDIPGYAHMHRLHHIDILDKGRLPLLISEPCHGSLRGYSTAVSQDNNNRTLRPDPQTGEPSDLWLTLASHMVLAMEFMEARDFVSVDIKDDNILYNVVLDSANVPHMHFMIADYGWCTPSNFKNCDYPNPADQIPRGAPLFRPTDAPEPDIESSAMAQYQIICALELAVDRRDLGTSALPFDFSNPPTRISRGNPYFELIYLIRVAINGYRISKRFAVLASNLRDEGLLH